MFTFIWKLLALLALISVVLVVVPNPIQYQFPLWIKNYYDFQDKQSNQVVEVDQLDQRKSDPLFCVKNADCILILCGHAPNCHSQAISNDYFASNKSNLPSEYMCPDLFEKDNCGLKNQLDAYAACNNHQCVIQRAFPSPTPKGIGLIERIAQ